MVATDTLLLYLLYYVYIIQQSLFLQLREGKTIQCSVVSNYLSFQFICVSCFSEVIFDLFLSNERKEAQSYLSSLAISILYYIGLHINSHKKKTKLTINILSKLMMNESHKKKTVLKRDQLRYS